MSASIRARTQPQTGDAMDTININKIAPPQRAATEMNYEADLKAVLEPVLTEVLDMTESAGWDRRKAAYTVMFLAARQLSDGKANPKTDV